MAADQCNEKYYKEIFVNNSSSKAYVDLGSSCTLIKLSEAKRLNLRINSSDVIVLRGYGNGRVTTLGTVKLTLTVDNVTASIMAYVVPDFAQKIPVMIGRTFTELPEIIIVKDNKTLNFVKQSFDHLPQEILPTIKKSVLRVDCKTAIPIDHWGHLKLIVDDYEGDLFIDAAFQLQKGREYCIPRTIVRVSKGQPFMAPCINLSGRDLSFKQNEVFARAWPCLEDATNPEILRVDKTTLKDLPLENILVGPTNEEQKQRLFQLLNKYRDCFSQCLEELGCAKSAELSIHLKEEKPFAYRPYRMARHEQDYVSFIIKELLENDIIR